MVETIITSDFYNQTVKNMVETSMASDLDEPTETSLVRAFQTIQNTLEFKNTKEQMITTALFACIPSMHWAFVKQKQKREALLKLQQQQQQQQQQDECDLCEAASNGDIEKMVFLVCEKQVNVDVRCGRPLLNSVSSGNTKAVSFLLQHGATVSVQQDMALCTAAIKGYYEIAHLLIAHQANTRSGKAMNLAIVHGHLDIVRLFVENGAPPITSANILTATRYNRVDILLYFKSSGVSVVHENVFTEAVCRGFVACAKILLSEEKNTEKVLHTCINNAAKNGHASMVSFLISHNFQMNMNHNDTFLEVILNNHYDVLVVLEHELGVDVVSCWNQFQFKDEDTNNMMTHAIRKKLPGCFQMFRHVFDKLQQQHEQNISVVESVSHASVSHTCDTICDTPIRSVNEYPASVLCDAPIRPQIGSSKVFAKQKQDTLVFACSFGIRDVASFLFDHVMKQPQTIPSSILKTCLQQSVWNAHWSIVHMLLFHNNSTLEMFDHNFLLHLNNTMHAHVFDRAQKTYF